MELTIQIKSAMQALQIYSSICVCVCEILICIPLVIYSSFFISYYTKKPPNLQKKKKSI